jgi:hypothetical protein
MSRQRPNKEASRNVRWDRSEAAINAGFELDVKRVQFLKEMFPKLSRLAVLYNPLDLGASWSESS